MTVTEPLRAEHAQLLPRLESLPDAALALERGDDEVPAAVDAALAFLRDSPRGAGRPLTAHVFQWSVCSSVAARLSYLSWLSTNTPSRGTARRRVVVQEDLWPHGPENVDWPLGPFPFGRARCRARMVSCPARA